MSRTIDATHTLDPSAGNDPSVNYKVAATDGASPVALDMDQLANAVAVRIGSAPPPDPTEDLNQLVVTIQNNTLTANIQAVTGVTYTHYAILLDDDTEPTYPADYTSGTIPSLISVAADPANPVSADWNATTTIYVWAYDLPTTTAKELLTTSAVSGIDVTTVDTLGPVWLPLTAGFSIDDNGAYTIVAPTDAGIGLATTATYDIYVDGVVNIANTTSLTGTVTAGAGVHTAHATARDKAGNLSQSDADSFTIAVQTAGTVSLPLVTQEVSEDLGGATTITLTRTGGTAPFNIDVSTRDIPNSAVAGTNYTAISSQTIPFAEFQNTETVDFTPLLPVPGSVENNVCNIEIDYDSADVAAGTVAVGTESVLMKIIGTGLTANAGYQMTTATPFYVSFQAESYNNIRASIETGQTSDQWAETGTDVRYAPEAGINKAMEAVSANNYGDDAPVPKIDPNGPYLEYDVHFTAEAVAIENANNSLYHVFARSEVKSTWNTSLLCTLVNPIVSIVISDPGQVATITTLYSHALSAADLVWFEDVTGTNAAEYNSPGGVPGNGLTVATATPGTKTFTVTGMTIGDPDAGTGNLLGSDPGAIRFRHPTGAQDSLIWIDNNGSVLPLFVDEAATRQFRVYMLFPSNKFDVITIAGETQAWTVSDVNVTNNGGPGAAGDDNMGHVQSIYSASSGGTPPDNPANPEFPYLPLPTATVASLSC